MVERLETAGLQFVGKDETGRRMEILELPGHPYYVGVQFHPEFKSRPGKPSAVFLGLILAASGQMDSYISGGHGSSIKNPSWLSQLTRYWFIRTVRKTIVSNTQGERWSYDSLKLKMVPKALNFLYQESCVLVMLVPLVALEFITSILSPLVTSVKKVLLLKQESYCGILHEKTFWL